MESLVSRRGLSRDSLSFADRNCPTWQEHLRLLYLTAAQNASLDQASKSFTNSFKELNSDEAFDPNSLILRWMDRKLLKNIQVGADQILRGTKTISQTVVVKLSKEQKADLGKNDTPFKAASTAPAFESLTYCLVSEYQKLVTLVVKTVSRSNTSI